MKEVNKLGKIFLVLMFGSRNSAIVEVPHQAKINWFRREVVPFRSMLGYAKGSQHVFEEGEVVRIFICEGAVRFGDGANRETNREEIISPFRYWRNLDGLKNIDNCVNYTAKTVVRRASAEREIMIHIITTFNFVAQILSVVR